MSNAIDISPEQLLIVQSILRKHLPKGARTWAFGSRVTWTAKDFSDLDLAVEHDAPLPSKTLINLEEDFEESDLPWRVDVIDLNAVSPEFRAIVKAQRVPADWTVCKLGDAADLLTGNPFKSSEYVEQLTSPRLLRGDNIAQGYLRWENVKHWPVNSLNGLEKYTLKEQDVVLAMDRPWIEAGLKYAKVSKGDLPALLVQRVARFRGTRKLRTDFLRYIIGSAQFTNYILSVQTGTAVPHISASQIKQFEVSLPPIEEQQRIAAVLSSLDDKIELNRRMNETLEALAQAIFKDWFVDFGPTRRKAEGATDPVTILGNLIPDPTQAQKTATLFPATFGDDGLPEGWTMGTVSDIGKVVCGKTPSTSVKEYYGNDVPFITIPEMHGKVFAFGITRKISKEGASSQAKKMLPKGSICVSCIATPGLVVITTEHSQTNQQINSVVPDQFSEVYYWFWILKRLGSEIESGGSGGSVLANLSTSRFMALQILSASDSVRKLYNDIVESMFDKLLSNERENRTLAETRDYLLPKLMSGQLRVRDAEKMVEDGA
jgi:type I restriction enzyme, S subunit